MLRHHKWMALLPVIVGLACSKNVMTDEEPGWPPVKVEHFDASRVPPIVPRNPAKGFEKPVSAEIRMRDGSPCVFLDGRPFALFWGGIEQPNPRPDKRMRIGDIPFSAVTVHNLYYEWHPSKDVWKFEVFDELAAKYAADNPGAYFIWDLSVYPPADFAERHPEEMTQDDEGDRKPVQRFSWSFSSEKALNEIKEMVDRAIRYLEASPYANRIIGYRVNSGTTIEWLGWEARPGHVNDFSEPCRRAFTAFAAKRYPELADPHIPSREERSALDAPDAILWNGKKHLNAIAYMDFASWIVAQDVLVACGQAKETLASLGRRKLVGTYYGYTFYLNVNGEDQRRAHFALRDLIAQNAGRVDFLMSPQSYGQRNFGETCGDMKPFATLAANGILPVIEDDTRTHNHPEGVYLDYFQTHNAEQTESILRRNIGVALCHGSPPYLYALCTGTDLDSPECAEVGRATRTLMETLAKTGVRRTAEVALVVSERSVVSTPLLSRRAETGRWIQKYDRNGVACRVKDKRAVFNGEVFAAAHTLFARTGAPVDFLLAEDLVNHPGTYKLYVFLNQFVFDDELAKAVERIYARGATVLWLTAPGWSNGNSLEDMKRLTGMTFAQSPVGVAGVKMKRGGRFMGMPGVRVAERFYPVRPDEVLGTYEDGAPGVAVSRIGKAQAVFSGPWQLDLPFAKELVRRAGVHVWCDSGDPVEANDRLFTLHARTPGRKKVFLPRTATVVDVFGKKVVTRKTDTFTFDAALHSSHLFHLEDER